MGKPSDLCYFRLDIQTVCGRTKRHGSHDRWERGDRNDKGPNAYSHPFTPRTSDSPLIVTVAP